MNFAVDIEFAHTPCNQLCYLRSKIENDDFLVHAAKVIRSPLRKIARRNVVKNSSKIGRYSRIPMRINSFIRTMLNMPKERNIKLASKSPRRQQLLQGLELDFEVWSMEVDESFPPHLKREEIPLYLAKIKADAFMPQLQANDILITADTIVWINDCVLNKPENRDEAISMLNLLSGQVHEVFTGVCLRTTEREILLSDCTKVHFTKLGAEEIEHYIDRYAPFDKAGSYGAQDWIGLVGIDKLEGSYFNVMGLPVHKVYQALKSLQ